MTESRDCSQIPRVSMDKIIDLTWRYLKNRLIRTVRYFMEFRLAQLFRLVSKPTSSSMTDKVLQEVEVSMSGCISSPKEGVRYRQIGRH